MDLEIKINNDMTDSILGGQSTMRDSELNRITINDQSLMKETHQNEFDPDITNLSNTLENKSV